MKLWAKAFLCVCLSVLLTGIVFAVQEDREGSKDHPLLSRMENYYIWQYKELEYDSAKFYDEEGNEYVIEGHKWVIQYWLKKGFKAPGRLMVTRNYFNAIKKIGGTILVNDPANRGLNMKVAKGGKETWIHVWPIGDGNSYILTIVETTIMEQEVVADPDAMAADISTTGHVAIYGIYFDLDSYAIKPESEPTLKAIADMLKANSSLKVYVVGHTDMSGKLEYNMELSSKRAEAVVNELVTKYGIDSSRLKSKGVGPLSPVSTNKTEEGRKLNRRVELVEMET